MAIKIERRFFMSVTVDAPEGIFLPANYPELITHLLRLGQSTWPICDLESPHARAFNRWSRIYRFTPV
jgi:hypothetical protein